MSLLYWSDFLGSLQYITPSEDLKSNIPQWVYWYNYNRPHQSLNYSTPAETLYKAYSSNNSNSFYLNFQDLNIVQEVKM